MGFERGLCPRKLSSLGGKSLVSLEDLTKGARFVSRLLPFLRSPLTMAESRAMLRRRIENREDNFLKLAKRIYETPRSPYRRLLDLAGCAYGDLEGMVRRDGLEAALHLLFRGGVFLTVDEIKGRAPVVRGSAAVDLNPDWLRNLQADYQRSQVLPDLAFLRELTVNIGLVMESFCKTEWRCLWYVPGRAAAVVLLTLSSFGSPATRWFSQVDPSVLQRRYRWGARSICWAGVLAGVPEPYPEYVPLEAPLSVARWIVDGLRAGHIPHVWTFPSSAVRLCRAAKEAGLDLGGARLTLSGEPTTDSRLAIIRQAGAEASVVYGSTECGYLAAGCLNPRQADDVHFFHDLYGLTQPGTDGREYGFPEDALLISSLHPSAPLVLLNASLGDQAILRPRQCGCSLEDYGWRTHLHTIRSYEKLTAGGMTFLDRDVIRVLEEVLPARYGGAPTDYQILEDEDENGNSCVKLLVHPTLGPLDENAIVDTFLSSMSSRSTAEQLMGLFWRNAGLLQVERRPPVNTGTGKILHLHQRGNR